MKWWEVDWERRQEAEEEREAGLAEEKGMGEATQLLGVMKVRFVLIKSALMSERSSRSLSLRSSAPSCF